MFYIIEASTLSSIINMNSIVFYNHYKVEIHYQHTEATQ